MQPKIQAPPIRRLLLGVTIIVLACPATARTQAVAVSSLGGAASGGNQKAAEPPVTPPSERYQLAVDVDAIAHDLGPAEMPSQPSAQPLQIGIHRRAGLSHAAAGQRFRNPDGTQIAVLAIRSPGAVSLRLHFTDFEIAPGDEVYVRGTAAGSRVAGPYRDKGTWNDGDFWSATVEGDVAIVEYHIKSAEGRFMVPELSHVYRRAGSDDSTADVLGCELDASCFGDAPRNAVARITFITNGDSYVCTGTLLNNCDEDYQPYLLTANHCISTQTEARTVETYWRYQTTSCNSNFLRSDWESTSGGADLLATNAANDSTLVRLIYSAPSSSTFSGWTSSLQELNTPVFGLHHPGNAVPPDLESYLSFAEGFVSSLSGTCLGNAYRVNWNQGTAEPGSSGSGLFIRDQARQSTYLVGVLSCGPNPPTCSSANANYGKFANFYPQIAGYLYPGCVSLETALDLGQLSVRTGGQKSWRGKTQVAHDGTDALTSGTVGHNDASWFETNVTGPLAVSFWWKVSSEPGYDFLRFELNGSQLTSIPRLAGNVDWQYRTVSLPAGANTLRWTYAKDGSFSSGADAGWVDQLRLGGYKTDFNADAFGDFVLQNTRTGERVVWFLRNGQFESGRYLETIVPEWRIAGTGDLNGDGHADFTWQNIRTGEHVVWFLRNMQFQSGFYFDTIPPEWQIASSADFNADGHADFVWQNSRTGEHVIWLLRNGRFQSGFYFDVIPPEWQIGAAADFNNDGHADFVWQNIRTGEHAVWFLRNGRYQSGFYFDTFDPAWRIAGATDLNTDGHADLLWQNINTGQRAVWFCRNGRYASGFYPQTIHPDWDLCVR